MEKRLNIFIDKDYDFTTTLSILILIGMFCGYLGFFYETIFYRIYLGYFIKRGSCFGCWVPIYSVGGFLVALFTYRLKEHPFKLFVISSFVTGTLEYLTGYFYYEYFGLRLWDYNTEIWNWGNVNGYICFRSILCFGISSLLLIYIVVPKILEFAEKMTKKQLITLSTGFFAINLLDVILYSVIK